MERSPRELNSPCHHSMMRTRVAVGGDGLEMWMVAVTILSKQSRTANKGWSSSLRDWARG